MNPKRWNVNCHATYHLKQKELKTSDAVTAIVKVIYIILKIEMKLLNVL